MGRNATASDRFPAESVSEPSWGRDREYQSILQAMKQLEQAIADMERTIAFKESILKRKRQELKLAKEQLAKQQATKVKTRE